MTRAIVIFSEDGVHPLSFLLKRGFKHCYCLIDDGQCWVLVDGKSGIPEIRAVAPSSQDMPAWCREQGVTALEVEIGDKPSPWPLSTNNCVGMCKSALVVRSLAFTPHQLYRHLRRRTNETSR